MLIEIGLFLGATFFIFIDPIEEFQVANKCITDKKISFLCKQKMHGYYSGFV